MLYGEENIALGIVRRYELASQNRGNWEEHWEDIAKRVVPHYSRSFQGQAINRTQGDKRTEEMIDATAALALPRFAAAMESMLTPRSSIWHKVIPSDKSLMRNRLVRIWFEQVTEILFQARYATTANYASQQHECYMGLGAFGTSSMFIDALRSNTNPRAKGLRYRAVHLGEIYFLENHQGVIDTAIRRFPMKARQAVQKFDPATLPEKIVNAAKDSSRCEDEFWFIHCVWPRAESRPFDPDRLDVAGMPFASDYVCEEEKKLVFEKGKTNGAGYYTFPYPIGRYVVAPGETYGRSPAMMALPSIKTLNEQKKTVLEQGHRAVRPVMLAYDDGVLDTLSLKPGVVNFGGVDSQGRELVKTLPVGQLSLAKEMMGEERGVIQDAFLITLFQILVDNPKVQTATEVLERVREKGAMLSPTMGRQHSEWFGPMIDRELDVLNQQGMLPEMPRMLQEAQGSYEIQYDSPLSRAQKAESATGFMRTIDWTRTHVELTGDPSPLDYADWDTAMPALFDINGTPPSWVRGPEAVAEIRKQRAAQAQQQQALEALPAAAGAAKALQPN